MGYCWINNDLLALKYILLKLEQTKVRSSLTIDAEHFGATRTDYRKAQLQPKEQYCTSSIINARCDQCTLFQVDGKLFHKNTNPTVPAQDTP